MDEAAYAKFNIDKDQHCIMRTILKDYYGDEGIYGIGPSNFEDFTMIGDLRGDDGKCNLNAKY
jgi:hypothetical protein